MKNRKDVWSALDDALRRFAEFLRIVTSFFLEKLRQTQAEAKAVEDRRQKQTALEWHREFEASNESVMRQMVAEAIRTASDHTECRNISSSIISAMFTTIVGDVQYWELVIPVTDAVCSLFRERSESSRLVENLNRVLKNWRSDAVQEFREKQYEVTNSSQSAADRNFTWASYYAKNFHRLMEMKVATVKVTENKMILDVSVANTAEAAFFSPQNVYWC